MTQHIAIVTASVGAGHNGAAAELARRLRDGGFAVDVHDLLDLLPRPLGSVLERGYHHQLHTAPWTWRATAAGFDHGGPARFAGWATRGADEPLLRALRPTSAAVVSTYPLASQLLGRLRRSGRLGVPAVTYLTDSDVHRTWVANGVDAHLAGYPASAAHARLLGAKGVQVVRPAVPPEFRPAHDAAEVAAARRAFRLPAGGPLVLVATGSLGIGRPERTAREIAATGLATPVVACGRHLTLHQRLTGEPGVVSLGWVDDMPSLLRACDVVIHNAGGLTCLEALATGRPVLTYRPLPGHGTANARALVGVVPWVRDRRALPDMLAAALSAGTVPDQLRHAPDPAQIIANLAAGDRAHLPLRRASSSTTAEVGTTR